VEISSGGPGRRNRWTSLSRSQPAADRLHQFGVRGAVDRDEAFADRGDKATGTFDDPGEGDALEQRASVDAVLDDVAEVGGIRANVCMNSRLRRVECRPRTGPYSEVMTVRVVFADDNYLVREGVAGLLTETADIDLVETVADPAALLAAVATHRPDAVLTDIRMPPTFTTEGIDAAKRIRADFPETGVVVLSQYVEEDYAFELLSEGVAGLGYLLKERVTQVDDLVRALYDVSRGGSALDPKVVEGLLARKSQQQSSALLALTEREHEVLRELATGRSNAATAKVLFMSERAVEKHVGSVFQKLGLVHESDINRRVTAVLVYLEATGGSSAR
jgi:DNA-binding NarL/FixJ family response regulator